ncbi:MAG: hypothetical protein ACJAYJ_005020 [Saprospiraceae bacterium]
MKINRLTEYYVFPIFTYISLSVLTYIVLYHFNIVENWPSNTTLNSGDAGYYHSIMSEGYQASGKHSNNAGFFPLFAYLWRCTNLNFVGISIFNGLLYLFSLSFLCKILKPDRTTLGFFMASPYLFFMWVPLSESLFFFFCVPILYGIIKDKWKYIFVGVFLASLTRPIFLFFIPAFVGMTLMSQPIEKNLSATTWKKIIFKYLLPCLLGVSMVVIFQYYQTGRWFIYFELQSTIWGRAFNYGPIFPLGYNTPYWNLNGSYLSFWIGAFTSIVGLKLLIDWFRKKEILSQLKNYELFSIIFICMSLMSILFFNATWMWNPSPDNSTGFMSTHFTGINRYIHPTAFFLVLLSYIFKTQKLKSTHYLWIFIATNLLWLCFDLNYYLHIQRYLAFGIPNLIIILLMLFHAYRWKFLAYILIATSFILQSILFNYYLGFVQVD